MRKHISLLLIVAFLAPAAAARQKGRGKAPGAREADAAERKAEEEQRMAQAVEILKGVVEGADEIRETR